MTHEWGMLIGPLENPSKQTASKWTYPHWWYTIEENKDGAHSTQESQSLYGARETKIGQCVVLALSST